MRQSKNFGNVKVLNFLDDLSEMIYHTCQLNDIGQFGNIRYLFQYKIMHTYLTLVIFGPNLEEKYCDIDSFTFSVGLQSIISGLKIKYKMFNNMTEESSKVSLICPLRRSLSFFRTNVQVSHFA